MNMNMNSINRKTERFYKTHDVYAAVTSWEYIRTNIFFLEIIEFAC